MYLLTYIDIIGSGRFGTVCKFSFDNTNLAVKKLYKFPRNKELGYMHEWNEISMLTQVHPNLVKVSKILLDESDYLLVVMELMESNLIDLLKKYPNIALDKRLSILCDVCDALEFLHSQNHPRFHGNLHSSNVFVTSTFQAKIGDIMPKEMIQKIISEGKLGNYAPRIITDDCSIESLDIFAFGLVACHLFTKCLPMPEGDSVELNEVERYEYYLNLIRNESAKILLTDCLHSEPNKRPSISVVLNKIKSIHRGKLI